MDDRGHRPAIGGVLAGVPHREIVGRAQRHEACGVDAVWLVEDCFQYAAISAAAAVLGATRQLHVGVGLFAVAVRNVAIFAMELATIAEMFPDRLTVGLGHGVETRMRQINARPPDRLVALRSTAGCASTTTNRAHSRLWRRHSPSAMKCSSTGSSPNGRLRMPTAGPSRHG